MTNKQKFITILLVAMVLTAHVFSMLTYLKVLELEENQAVIVPAVTNVGNTQSAIINVLASSGIIETQGDNQEIIINPVVRIKDVQPSE